MAQKIQDFARSMVARYDENRDGKVDVQAERRHQVIATPGAPFTYDGARLFEGANTDGDAFVTSEEMLALATRFDANGDGKLTDAADNPLTWLALLAMGFNGSHGLQERLERNTEVGAFNRAYPQR
jgi:hypothetical protein